FLWSMSEYKFEEAPEALEAIFNALPEEGDQVVMDFIATNPEIAPRLVKVLINIDEAKGTRFAQNLIARSNTPDKIFIYFARLFSKNRFFSRNILPFLSSPKELPAIRRLFAQNPNQFNTVFDTLTQLGIKSLADEELLWEGLLDLGSLTPGVYGKYRSLGLKERKDFAQLLEQFDYTAFFKNKPISSAMNDLFDKDVQADFLYRAYNPTNMSYEQVKELLPTVKDRTDDLKSYVFPESYDLTFSLPSFELKKDEKLNEDTLQK